MLRQQKIFFFSCIFLCFQLSFSQENSPKKDSLELYKSIQTYSKKHKFTTFAYQLFFKPINSKARKNRNIIQTNYNQFEGKIIRKIDIRTLDPFGYSEMDSIKKARNWVEKQGNLIHIKTKRLAVQNVLLIHENRPLDSLLVKESMRLIRAQSYSNRVALDVKLIEKNSDSVDVFIRVLDAWTLLPRVSTSTNTFNFQLNERNFYGLGHTLNTQYQKTYDNGKNAYNFEYTVPNIKNTFIKTTLVYFKDLNDNYAKTIAIDRTFYSPFAKWAGGINLDQQYKHDTLANANLVFAKLSFKYNSQDFWAGYAFKIFSENNQEQRLTNLIVTGRILTIKYIESPTIEYDPINFYASERFILAGIGVSTRKYVEDKYIFKNGIIEDVPIGKIYGITAGYQYKNNLRRLYLGSQVSFGNYFDWGFLSLNFEMGTFFNKMVTSQTAFSFQANYFSNLIPLGKWKLRQFIKPQLIIGINRQNANGDQLTISEQDGFQGIRSAIYGNQKAIFTFQTQTYSPWNVCGFRLNPYFNYTIAALGTGRTSLLESKNYSKIGIGFLITNDYLLFSTFQISLSYYPTIPGTGNDILRTNALETSDFGFQDFGLGKPRTVLYK